MIDVAARGGDLGGGGQGDRPLQKIRWRGRRCFYPPHYLENVVANCHSKREWEREKEKMRHKQGRPKAPPATQNASQKSSGEPKIRKLGGLSLPFCFKGLCALNPQIQKPADVISEVPKCSKIQIFWGSARTPLGSLQRSLSALQISSWWGEGSLARVSGLTHYRVGNPTNDRFQMCVYIKFVFFRFRRTEKMDSVMKRLMGQCPQQNFWASPCIAHFVAARNSP